MKPNQSCLLVLSAALLAGCVVAEIQPEPRRGGERRERPRTGGRMVQVHEVQSVEVRVLESFPEQLHITARGQANSVARYGQLRPRGVRGGVHEFDFVARMPDGPTTMMMGPITAHHGMPRPPGLRGVRVFAQSNAVTERVP